jgi:hypothetical protein
MDGTTYEATIVNGQICLPANVHLHENAKVLVVVPREAQSSSGRIFSPRLAHPEQAAEFRMEVREVADAGV